MKHLIMLAVLFGALLSPMAAPQALAQTTQPGQLPPTLNNFVQPVSEEAAPFINLFKNTQALAVVLIVVFIVVGALAIVILGKTQIAMNVMFGMVVLFASIFILSVIVKGFSN